MLNSNQPTNQPTLAIHWHPQKNFTEIVPGEPLRRGVKCKRGSDFWPIEGYISETVQDRSKLVLITNRKLYIGFRLVPKLVTLNDHERRNGPYFALFHRIGSFRGALCKSSRSISHLQMSFLFNRGIAGSHEHCKSGNILKIVQDRDLITTDH